MLQKAADAIMRLLQPMGLFELVLTGLVVAAALWRPRLGAGAFEGIERRFARLLDRPWLQLLLIVLLAVGLRAAMLPALGVPVPRVNDEFSLILQGETFAAGRLANPTHPLAQSFEAVHINQTPTYSSIYFPGRGLPQWAGLMLAGHPWIGVWLSVLLLAAASLWMLRGWVRPGYALAGALIVVLRFGVFSYWVNGYWGGAFTAFGAALVVGAYPRILRKPLWRDGVLLGAGVAVLMTSRPYEGLLLCAPFALGLLGWLTRSWRDRLWLPPFRIAIPALLFAGAGAAFLGVYNLKTTGDLFTTPYGINRAQYAIAPPTLISNPLKTPERLSIRFRAFYDDEARSHRRRNSVGGIINSTQNKLSDAWMFYIGPALTIPFLLGLTRIRRAKMIGVAGVVLLAGFLVVTWDFPHYVAPALPLILVVIMLGFERLREIDRPKPETGLFLSRALPAILALALIPPAANGFTGWPSVGANFWSRACCAMIDSSIRSRIIDQLQRTPGRDLMIVRYDPDGSVHEDWVYNPPDIDSADVVWARDCGPTQNKRLIDYYRGRRIWLVTEVGRGPTPIREISGVPPPALGDNCAATLRDLPKAAASTAHNGATQR